MAPTPANRLILLTGSPLATSLEWTAKYVIHDDLLPAFQDIYNQDVQSNAEPSSHRAPVWRSLPLETSTLGRELTDLAEFGGSFDGERSSPQLSEQLLTQYYEHSLALHDELPSSQIIGSSSTHAKPLSSSDVEEYSFLSSEQSIDRVEQQQVQARLQSTHLSDLKESPNASYLHSISPQTMSVNLVVGIIAIAQPRAIRTRKDGRWLELVEMTVGDETRSGFGINIWLPPLPPQARDSGQLSKEGNDASGQAHDLRDVVLNLRPRDIILARRVGLSSFRGVVYGQSLRRGMTTVDLLYRSVVDRDDVCGAFRAREIDGNEDEDHDESSVQLAKVRRVKDWVMRFVGMGSKADDGKSSFGEGQRHLPSLPSDTQPDE